MNFGKRTLNLNQLQNEIIKVLAQFQSYNNQIQQEITKVN